MHVAKLVILLLLASPALAADTALPIARPDLAKLDHQLARSSARAVRSMRAMAARSTAADAPDPFAPDRRSLAEDGGFLLCDLMNDAMRCGYELSATTCAAESGCSWSGTECESAMDVQTEFEEQWLAAAPMLFVPLLACSVSDATACPTEFCVVYGNTCSLNDAVIDAAVSDPTVAEVLKVQLQCQAYGSEDSCTAMSGCQWSEVSAEDVADGSANAGDMICGITESESLYLTVIGEHCVLDPITGAFSPVASAGVVDAVDSALLGAALVAGFAALA